MQHINNSSISRIDRTDWTERCNNTKTLSPKMLLGCAGRTNRRWSRRRENMVGVNMVLAENHQIQTWLLWIYLLFAIWGCFDGILLKPCLLQPCFHVAGDHVSARHARAGIAAEYPDFGEHATSAPAELGGKIHNVSRNRARTQVLPQARKLHVYGSGTLGPSGDRRYMILLVLLLLVVVVLVVVVVVAVVVIVVVVVVVVLYK